MDYKISRSGSDSERDQLNKILEDIDRRLEAFQARARTREQRLGPWIRGTPSVSVIEDSDGGVSLTAQASTPGSIAPVDAQYIVAAADGTLTAERVATDTTTVTWDFGTAGQAKANVPNLSGTNTGDQLTFKTIAVSGQSDVVADTATDTLTLVAGTNVTITTDATTDSVTINSTASGGSWTYSTKNSNFNAAADNIYAVTANSVTATLPGSPTAGDKIRFIIEAGVTGFTASRNGNEIMNTTNDLTVSYTPYAFELTYNANMGWVVSAA